MERTSKGYDGDRIGMAIIYSTSSLKTIQTKLFNEPDGDDGEEILIKYRSAHKR